MRHSTLIRCTTAHVDLAALAANYRAIAATLAAERNAALSSPALRHPAPPEILAVVKANAYGHGAVPVARTLETAGARWLAVADIEEGVELREAGITARILVFGALSVSDLEGIFSHDLTPTISSPSAARALDTAAAARGRRVRCHLKIDTGMHRLGLRYENLPWTLPPVAESAHLEIEAVYTHFGTADDPEHPLFEAQRQAFDRACEGLEQRGLLPRLRHAANSAALLRDSRVWYDLVRPGLLLYGVTPPPLRTTIPLRPVISLTSRVVAVKDLREGEAAGYGARFRAPRATRMAVVPAGYADGLDRRLEGRGVVLVRGRRAPIIGAVSMDMLTIDVTGIDGVAPGDEVVLMGSQGDQVLQTIDTREMASWIGTVPYEVLCRLGARVTRRYA